ncbi:MAG: hypothetical protein RMJ98_07645 [Myxococcales bacterium]|nr:hypothetical protein [Polyangiaceae bacterium]MDW8249159.1 hypothetical protein [Myxococcales bacterium]
MTRGWLHGMLLAGFLITAALEASQRTPKLVLDSSPNTLELSALEARVAHTPQDQRAVLQLARTLLEQNEPGMALAVLERSPKAMERSPEGADLIATVQMRMGKNRAALASTKHALMACERQGCEGILLARNTLREELLEVLLTEGIEDVEANPEATAQIYRQATRQVHLAIN